MYLLALLACNAQKSLGDEKCTHSGEVKDYSELDGCKTLILTADGKKLSPINFEKWTAVLQVGNKIRFGYKEAEPMMSICMVEDGFIEITCAAIQE